MWTPPPPGPPFRPSLYTAFKVVLFLLIVYVDLVGGGGISVVRYVFTLIPMASNEIWNCVINFKGKALDNVDDIWSFFFLSPIKCI